VTSEPGERPTHGHRCRRLLLRPEIRTDEGCLRA
jgi:hypothetical protein